jgi:internalin A
VREGQFVTFDPEQWNRWNSDASAAYEEADRRIAQCAESRCEQLDLAMRLETLPPGLGSLTWLRELDLYGAPVDDYAPLEPLKHLATLKLGSLHAPFPGLAFLGAWENLEVLQLICTTALDLAPLRRCIRLERLGISCSQNEVELKNLAALSGCADLTHVTLLNMQSDQYDTIGDWPVLEFAQIIGANLTSLDMFAGLTRLEYLNVSGSPVDPFAPLSRLQNLRTLDVSDTNLRDLAPVAKLSSLEEFSCNRTAVGDLQPLADLSKSQASHREATRGEYKPHRRLTDVKLAGCPIYHLGPLHDVEGLSRLDASETEIASLEPLHNHRNLWALDISNTAISDLGSEGSLANLGYLTATNCPIERIDALAPALRMQAINLTATQVADLRPLRRARGCRSLHLRGSRVKDLGPLLETGDQVEDHRYSPQQLDFRDTPAASSSAEFAQLAALADVHLFRCFTETKCFLRARQSSGVLGRFFGKLSQR